MKKYFAFTVIIGIFTAASYITGNAVGQDRKKPTSPQPATIGLVDVSYVFKHYKKAGDQQGQFEAEVQNKESEFKGLADQIKQVGNERKRFNSGTVEYQQKDDQLTSLQADLAAKARQADKAFAKRQATMLRNLYGDVNSVIRSGRSSRSRQSDKPNSSYEGTESPGAVPRCLNGYHKSRTEHP